MDQPDAHNFRLERTVLAHSHRLLLVEVVLLGASRRWRKAHFAQAANIWRWDALVNSLGLPETSNRFELPSEGRIEKWERHKGDYSAHTERVNSFVLHEIEAARTPLLRTLETQDMELTLTARERTTQGRDESRAFTTLFNEVSPETPSIGIKDMVQVAGHSLTLGTRAYESQKCKEDAPVISSLKDAGIGIAGMLNQHALAYGATGISSQMGSAVNALDPDAMPGGSSSGSGVAVANRFVDYALGTDTGGSVRIPASLNGVVGFKPTFGRLPMDGVAPLAPSLDHLGLMARNVKDTAAVFTAIDPSSHSCHGLRVAPGEEITLGLPRAYFLEELDQETRTSFEQLLRIMGRQENIRFVDIELSGAEIVASTQLAIMAREALETNLQLLRTRGDLLPEDVRLRLELGRWISDHTYQQAKSIQEFWKQSVEAAFGSCHAILLPAVPIKAPRLNDTTAQLTTIEVTVQNALTRLTAPFNLSGHPAVTLPFREPNRRIPLGIQLVGPFSCDLELLAIASAIEGFVATTGAE